MTLQTRNKTVVLAFSGGQDSTTVLGYLLSAGYSVIALSLYYGQRHFAEVQAAKRVVAYFRSVYREAENYLTHEVLELPENTLMGSSPLLSGSKQPLEQYADHASLPGGLEKTFVPMRNQLFLTIAANRAYASDTNIVATGVCQEDFGGYPDCTDRFIRAFVHASSIGTFTGTDGAPDTLRVLTPLMFATKAETVALALDDHRYTYQALGFSHTSYDGNYPPTGRDHATLLRAKGFEEAGVPDPLVLRAFAEGVMFYPETSNYSPEVITHTVDRLEQRGEVISPYLIEARRLAREPEDERTMRQSRKDFFAEELDATFAGVARDED